MTSMTLFEQLKRYAFATVATGLAIAGSWGAVVPATPPLALDPPATPVAHKPYTALPDLTLRDPFVTGAEWRARMRERLAPRPPPTVAVKPPPVEAPPAAPPAPPPGSELGFSGSMQKGTVKYAILNEGMVREGGTVGRYTIESVHDDHMMVRFEGRLFKVTPSSGSSSDGGATFSTISTPITTPVAPSPATTSPGN